MRQWWLTAAVLACSCLFTGCGGKDDAPPGGTGGGGSGGSGGNGNPTIEAVPTGVAKDLSSFPEILKHQTRLYKEMAAYLEQIKDASGATSAKGRLEAIAAELMAANERSKDLGPVDPRDIVADEEAMKKQKEKINAQVERLKKQPVLWAVIESTVP